MSTRTPPTDAALRTIDAVLDCLHLMHGQPPADTREELARLIDVMMAPDAEPKRTE